MPQKSPLEYCPPHIKADLLNEHTTTTKTTHQLSEWLRKKHGIRLSKSAIHRFLQKHKGQLITGLSPETLADHADDLEELKGHLLNRELTQRRIDAMLGHADQLETAGHEALKAQLLQREVSQRRIDDLCPGLFEMAADLKEPTA